MNPLKSHLPLLWVDIANTFHQINLKSINSFVRLSNANPQVLFKNLPQLGKDLERGLESGHFELSPGTFKKYKGTCYPIFLQEYFKEVFDKEGYLRDHFDPFILRELRTLCYLFYKYEVPFSPEEVTTASNKFLEVDDMVKTTFTDSQILPLKEVVKDLLPDDPFDIRPRHSSGATADGYTNAEKRYVKRYIPELHSVYGLDVHFNSASHYNNWKRNNTLVSVSPHSKVTFVPKDSRGPRTICMEPHERMFVQQGIMHKLYEHIESVNCPAMGRINFSDQTINQKLAYESSMSRKHATIDLKDASDLVSWELVKQVFPSDWVVALEATRSASAVLPDGRVKILNKFAPMGSALCFPIEAIVFYSICRLVTDEVWVYGDDIIIPTHYAGEIMDLLESYGLLINRDKSLYKGFFRESCGGDYFRGQNITPIRCKSVDLESTYALANNLADAFGHETGEAVCRWYESIVSTILLRLPISYKEDTSLLAYFTKQNNEYLVCTRRWNPDLQKYEIRGLGRKQKTKTYNNSCMAYDMLFDYFTNDHKSNSPKSDSHYQKLAADWIYTQPKPSWSGSTSSVYSNTISSIGYTWVSYWGNPLTKSR